jgi:hypothetical protein
VGASVKRINARGAGLCRRRVVSLAGRAHRRWPAFKLFDERSETFRHRLSQFGVAGMKCLTIGFVIDLVQNRAWISRRAATAAVCASRSDALENLCASYPDGTAIWTRVCCDPSYGYGSRADKTS